MGISKLKVSDSEVYTIKDKKVNDYLKSLRPNNIKFFNGVKWRPNKHDNWRNYHTINDSSKLQNILYSNEHVDRCKYMYIEFPLSASRDNPYIYVCACSSDIGDEKGDNNIYYYKCIFDLPRDYKRILVSNRAYLLNIKALYKVLSWYIFGYENDVGVTIIEGQQQKKERNCINICNSVPDYSSPTNITISNMYINNFLKIIDKDEPLQKFTGTKYNLAVYRNRKIYYTPKLCKIQEIVNKIIQYCNPLEYSYNNLAQIFYNAYLELYFDDHTYLIYEFIGDNSINLIKYINIKEIKFSDTFKSKWYDYNNYVETTLLPNIQSRTHTELTDNPKRINKLTKALIMYGWLGMKMNGLLGDGNNLVQPNDIEYIILHIKLKNSKRGKYTIIPNYYIKLSYINGKIKCSYVDKYTQTFVY